MCPLPHQARGQTRQPGENNIGSMLSLEMTRKGLWTESGDGHHRLGFSFRLSMAMANNTRVFFLIESWWDDTSSVVTDPNNSGAGLGEKETSASKAQVTNTEKIDTPSGWHHAGLSTGTSPDRKTYTWHQGYFSFSIPKCIVFDFERTHTFSVNFHFPNTL